jgi:hypothetical protein
VSKPFRNWVKIGFLSYRQYLTGVELSTIIIGTEGVKRGQISRLREGNDTMTNDKKVDWKPTFVPARCYHFECDCDPIVKLTPYGDSQEVREMIAREQPELLEEHGII